MKCVLLEEVSVDTNGSNEWFIHIAYVHDFLLICVIRGQVGKSPGYVLVDLVASHLFNCRFVLFFEKHTYKVDSNAPAEISATFYQYVVDQYASTNVSVATKIKFTSTPASSKLISSFFWGATGTEPMFTWSRRVERCLAVPSSHLARLGVKSNWTHDS